MAKTAGSKTAKTAKAKTAKKDDKPKVEKREKRIPARLKVWKGTQADLAFFLGLTDCAVRDLRNKGIIEYEPDGEFDLSKAVQMYVKWVRDARKRETQKSGKAALDEELVVWKIERAKMAIRDFRLSRYREVALEVLGALRQGLERLKKECRLVPRLAETIDTMLEAVGSIDVADIAYTVEGAEGDDEED